MSRFQISPKPFLCKAILKYYYSISANLMEQGVGKITQKIKSLKSMLFNFKFHTHTRTHTHTHTQTHMHIYQDIFTYSLFTHLSIFCVSNIGLSLICCPQGTCFLEIEIHSVLSDSLRVRGLYSPWNSLGQNTGVGSLSSQPRNQTRVSCIAGGFFTSRTDYQG